MNMEGAVWGVEIDGALEVNTVGPFRNLAAKSGVVCLLRADGQHEYADAVLRRGCRDPKCGCMEEALADPVGRLRLSRARSAKLAVFSLAKIADAAELPERVS